jgi:serine/threonine-protein kinase HipA
MITTAFVNIWETRVGAIAWDSATGMGRFEFVPDFKSHQWDLSPIAMPLAQTDKRIFSFPETRNTNTFKGLPGLIADVLPDKYGNALINTWLLQQGRPADSLNPVELLCFIGNRGMGALTFQPAQYEAQEKATKVEIKHLVEVAEAILSGRKNFMAGLSKNDNKALLDILKIGTSAGGARAKAVIAYNPETGAVRSGQTEAPAGFSQWLIKFDGVTDQQFGASGGYGRVEMAYYRMALDAGIEMMESRLLEENDRAHFMTRRFDRLPDNQKLHFQSFCALRHFDYNDVGIYSYESLFETMRMLYLPYPQAEQMFRRMVFNVMGRNCDDHTKNFGFTMTKNGQWQLSPAYDVCHAYRPGSHWVSRHSLSINGKRDNIEKGDLLAVAKQMNIKKAEAIIDEIGAVISNWNHYAKQVGVEKTLRKAIEKTLHIL